MNNKSILITGGTSGIGLATAKLLASEGAKVIITGRNPATLDAAKKQLPGNAIVLKSDAASLADARAIGQLVAAHVSRLDGAFLNAGIARFTPFAQITPEDYEEHFNVNVRGLIFQLQSLLPLLANPSSVVFTASVVAELGMDAASVYSATKAAVVSLGKTLATELAPRGIRVNTLSPGPTETPIFHKMGGSADDVAKTHEYLGGQTLLKRMGTPEEMAKAARFLLSDDSSFLVGSELLADGGIRLT